MQLSTSSDSRNSPNVPTGRRRIAHRNEAEGLLLEIPELLARVVAVPDDDRDRVGVVPQNGPAKALDDRAPAAERAIPGVRDRNRCAAPAAIDRSGHGARGARDIDPWRQVSKSVVLNSSKRSVRSSMSSRKIGNIRMSSRCCLAMMIRSC